MPKISEALKLLVVLEERGLSMLIMLPFGDSVSPLDFLGVLTLAGLHRTCVTSLLSVLLLIPLALLVWSLCSSLLACISLSRCPRLFFEGVIIGVVRLLVLRFVTWFVLGVGVLTLSELAASSSEFSWRSSEVDLPERDGFAETEIASELAPLVVGGCCRKSWSGLLAEVFVAGQGRASSPFCTPSIVLKRSKLKGKRELVRTESG